MTIADARKKCKSLVIRVRQGAQSPQYKDILILAILVLASSASFGLGLLAGRNAGQGSDGSPLPVAGTTTTPVVASKNGTKYYTPDCSAAARISDANKVWFVSASAAREAGYEPALNCKGL